MDPGFLDQRSEIGTLPNHIQPRMNGFASQAIESVRRQIQWRRYQPPKSTRSVENHRQTGREREETASAG